MSDGMHSYLSRRRFELLSLALALAACGLHAWVESTPAIGLLSEGSDAIPLVARLVHQVEGRITDVQFHLRGVRPPHPDVLVAAVDEKSVQVHGRWPWPREKLAQAVDHLREAGAAAVGLDMAFADEDANDAARAYTEAGHSLDKVLSEMSEGSPGVHPLLAAYRAELSRRSSARGDAALAAALARSPRVVQGVIIYPSKDRARFAAQEEARASLLEPHLLRQYFSPLTPGAAIARDFEQVPGWRNQSVQLPLPELARASPRLGFFNTVPDADGPLRRQPILAKLEGPRGFLASLDVQTAAAYFDAEAVEPVVDSDTGRLEGVRLRRRAGEHLLIPISESEPFTLINYPGPASAFPTLSLGDVVDGTFDPATVRGKAVLVGLTLTGNFDQRVTPFSEFEPGVFVRAAFLSNILGRDFLVRPLLARWLEMGFMLASAWLLARLLPRVRYAWKLGTVALLMFAYAAVDQFLFGWGVQVATAVPLATVGACAFAVLFLGYRSVDQEKARLRHAFQHYLDSSVMEQVLAHPERLKLGGERRELTVLFSDIRGFTTLSEQLTPERLVSLVNEYLTPMTDVVFAHGGTLDKYIGDALMCFWGAPVAQPDHALRACRAALGFLEALQRLNAGWRAAGLPEVDIGVGLSTGPMNVGHMGTHGRFSYTVMGDAVNLGSRLEGLNKEYGTRVLISEQTWLQVREHVTARRLGAVRVKGKHAPVGVYELRALGLPTGKDAEAVAAFEAGVDSFLARDWTRAQERFERVLTLWADDTPSRRFLDAIATFQLQPPGPDWDGVFTATTK
ncbi:adenylate/guanylate cyclase domain-containing protein [Myxococcaceae bacterium JPH2]|nr:adenylate/guanylate cyclase domain-containing protein [Myxococcaceae bacterium JPH2]